MSGSFISAHTGPPRLTVAPHLPQNPTIAHQARPGGGTQSPPALSARSGRGLSTEDPRSGKERAASVSHLRLPSCPSTSGVQSVKVRASCLGPGVEKQHPKSQSKWAAEPILQGTLLPTHPGL